MEEKLEISLDKLPIKRLEAIEENGLERYPSDVGYEEKRVNEIRRIDFAWAVGREDPNKKQKTTSASSKESATSWPWQSMVENLQLAQQELSVIIDLINTLEANDAVTVASMTRPKPLPNEHVADLAVSTATKLQCFRHLGKYFKQSANALERQVTREARFYGALIRLQQNWKVKRQRIAVTSPANEGFYIDLFDNVLNGPSAISRPPAISAVRIEHDPSGMLSINLPPRACRFLQFCFSHLDEKPTLPIKLHEANKESLGDDASVKDTHSILREVHYAIFNELVFELVNREAFNQSFGVQVIVMQENYLQLSIEQGVSVTIQMVSSEKNDQITEDSMAIERSKLGEGIHDKTKKISKFPSEICYQILLEQIFHQHVLVKAKNKAQLSNQPKDVSNLLGHFCISLAHRIFSNKVLNELESLVSGIPYVHLMSHPSWHSRTSSWTLFMNVPQSILHDGVTSQFRTKIVVEDDRITIEGEGAPNVVGLFKGRPEITCSIKRYECGLSNLSTILLQLMASQVIRWLHKEALMVGVNAKRDYLSLSFEVDQGKTLGLVAHIDPEDSVGCICWWLVIEQGIVEPYNGKSSDTRKFLGHLSLDVLYSTLLDLVSLCTCTGSGVN
ncbi:mediator of RNA polymerase II transcription subunit 17 [Impatiens glandulifera]|uniref:mediator of RNA polymerase II transcription subunit 17 n=1 Tax=Impatiens glandulifera TaxID=253017 RepID=UPI001FB15C51|nr:mediator of RNA polymerase II transcription subunit 17 [Impatiens glandulifera]